MPENISKERIERKWKIMENGKFSLSSPELQKAMKIFFPKLFSLQSFPSNDHERMCCCRGNFELCNQKLDIGT
jgi:hypothetical protein